MKSTLMKFYGRIICAAFSIMLLFISLGLIVGVARLFLNVTDLLVNQDVTGQYMRIISEVLTLFILIELARSLTDYFSEHRLRMTFIVDAGIVFVLREIMIGLFEHKIGTAEIQSFSVLMMVLGALRIGSILVFQREKRMLDAAGRSEPQVSCPTFGPSAWSGNASPTSASTITAPEGKSKSADSASPAP
jgi:uncharacterized membrane protein (DUF373 family)